MEEMDRFLQGEMSQSEAADFTKRLREEDTLRQNLSEYKWMQTAIREAALQERLEEFHQTLKTRPENGAGKRFFHLRATWRVAAVVLIIAGAAGFWMLYLKNSPKQIYSRYYSPDPGLMSAMSGEPENYEFKKAMVEYKNGDYTKAQTAWERMLRKNPASDTLLYFIGAAAQAAGEQEKAVIYLQKVVEIPNSAFQKDASWYLGLELMKKGETETAKKYIQQSGYPQSSPLLKEFR